MDIKSIIRKHYSSVYVSFNQLDQQQKRELAVYQILADKCYDQLYLNEKTEFSTLLFEYVVKKRVTIFDVIEKTLDEIIERNASNWEEIFEEIKEEREEINYPLTDFHSPDGLFHSRNFYL